MVKAQFALKVARVGKPPDRAAAARGDEILDLLGRSVFNFTMKIERREGGERIRVASGRKPGDRLDHSERLESRRCSRVHPRAPAGPAVMDFRRTGNPLRACGD